MEITGEISRIMYQSVRWTEVADDLQLQQLLRALFTRAEERRRFRFASSQDTAPS